MASSTNGSANPAPVENFDGLTHAQIEPRLNAVKQAYADLEEEYLALPLHVRRNVSYRHQVNRYFLASILSHRPSRWDFHRVPFGLDDVQKSKQYREQLTPQERCPVALQWFMDIRRLESELHYRKNVAWANFVVYRAEAKLTEVRRMLSSLKSPHGYYQLHPDNLIIADWNKAMRQLEPQCGIMSPPSNEQIRIAFKEAEPLLIGQGQPRHYLQTSTWLFPMGFEYNAWNRWHITIPACGELGLARPAVEPEWLKTAREEALRFEQAAREAAKLAEEERQKQEAERLQAAKQVEEERKRQDLLRLRAEQEKNYPGQFSAYNTKWGSLPAHSADFPYPCPGHRLEFLQDTTYLPIPKDVKAKLSVEKIIQLNTKTFFLKAASMRPEFSPCRFELVVVKPSAYADKMTAKVMLRAMRLSERARWHTDKLARRTGNPDGEVDVSIGDREEVKAIRSAIDSLILDFQRLV